MTWVNAHGARLIALEVVFQTLITLAVLARTWSLRLLKRKLIAADYLAFIAWASATALNACIIWSAANGLGAYSFQLSPAERVIHAKTQVSSEVTWTTATSFCKLSILFFCLHIFDAYSSFRWAAKILIILCILYEIIFVPVLLTQCSPPSAAWTGKGTCRQNTTYELSSVIGNLVLDTAVVVLPLPYIWSLRMPIFKKIGLSFVFSIGFTIVAIFCWRLSYTLELESGTLDESYALYIIAIQSTLEVSLGVLAACLPTLTPISTTFIAPKAKHLFSTLRDKFSKSNTSTSSGANRSRKDAKRSNSPHPVWPRSDDDIPFAYVDTHRHTATVTHEADSSVEDKERVVHNNIHVFREVGIDEEVV